MAELRDRGNGDPAGAALRMSPEFWLNAQQAVDIYHAARKLKKIPEPIPLAG